MTSARSLLLLLVIGATLTSCSGERIMLRNGERIIFFGDSITEQGVSPKGYVTLIKEELKARYPDLVLQTIGAGVSGNKVTDLAKRLSRDVIERNPTVVVIYIGINDVWHWALPDHFGTTKEDYEKNLREIIARIRYFGAAVLLCTPTVIGEKTDSSNGQDKMLEQYCAINRKISLDEGICLCDLHQAFMAYLKEHNEDNREKGVLTTDRVHLNDAGNRLVANEMLRLLGEH